MIFMNQRNLDLGLKALLSGATVISTWATAPILAPSATAQTPQANIAEGRCYLTLQQVGVYREPNAQSAAVSVLPANASITLGSGSGQGWLRVAEPVVGWLQATALQPAQASRCTAVVPAVPSNPSPALPLVTTGPVSCQVVAPEGLAIRNLPVIADRTVTAILPPNTYRFQFTDRQVQLNTNGTQRDWVYINAPQVGWIWTRVTGTTQATLGGQGCG
jgi:hypothetical protein